MANCIQRGSKIVFYYRVIADQKVVDVSHKPVTIIVGEGKFLKALEEALIGHEAGEEVVIVLPPEKHYGKYDPKKIKVVPRERLPDKAKVGQVVYLPDEMGILHPAIVRRIDSEMVVIDFNHPLAGKLLRFELKILEVSPPESSYSNNYESSNELS